MTTYCAPCLADLALVREASTAVAGTASCMAHAVLLTHPTDDPQRRRQRLAQLRDAASEKLETAGPEERLRLEILMEEYGLASAMESLVPRRRDEGAPTSRSARKRRGRDGRERPEGSGAPGGPAQGGEGRGRGPRPGGDGRPGPAPAPDGAVADGSAEHQGAEALAQVGATDAEPPPPRADAPGGDAPAGDAPAAEPPTAPAPAAEPPTAPAPAAEPPTAPAPAAEPPTAPAPAAEPPTAPAPAAEPPTAPSPDGDATGTRASEAAPQAAPAPNDDRRSDAPDA